MTSSEHAQALKLYRTRMNAPLKSGKKESAAASIRDALNDVLLALLLPVMLTGVIWSAVTTSRDAETAQQLIMQQIKAEEKAAAEFENFLRSK